MAEHSIPVVDLAPFAHGDSAARARVAAEVASACERSGFLVVRGHEVAAESVERLRAAAGEFFALPLESKLIVRRPRDDQNRGYIPYGEETLVRMHGGDSPPDFKEVFAIGPDELPDEPYFTGPAAYPSFAPNLWPQAPADLRPAMRAYFAAMESLMTLLGRVFAHGLGLPTGFFDDRLDKHTSQLRLLHYPALERPLAPGQLRCGPHTDLGMMTILHNEAKPGGLQVRLRSGVGGAAPEWIDVPDVADSFVVNLGDMMMRWTNDRWTSTPHRVAVPAAPDWWRSERLSIGFFVGPNYDALIECLPTCLAAHEDPRYAPITAHDYRTDRFAAGAGAANR